MESHDFSREVNHYNAFHLLCENTYIVFRSDRNNMNNNDICHLEFKAMQNNFSFFEISMP